MLYYQRGRIFFSFILFFITLWMHGQSTYLLQGTIKDNQEPLIGATIYIDEINNGVITNEKGFYSIELKEGSYTLKVSYIGYTDRTTTIHLTKK